MTPSDDEKKLFRAGNTAAYYGDGLADEALFLQGFLDLGTDGGLFKQQHGCMPRYFKQQTASVQQFRRCKASFENLKPLPAYVKKPATQLREEERAWRCSIRQNKPNIQKVVELLNE